MNENAINSFHGRKYHNIMWRLCLYVTVCSAAYYFDGLDQVFIRMRKTLDQPNYNDTFFNYLENYQVNAKPVSEAEYPWIARVVHSSRDDKPHVCTAICIEDRIFITAARSLFGLKVSYTRLIYNKQKLKPIALVVSKNGTKQAFDDIGFIVVDDYNDVIWNTIQPIRGVNRTDDNFDWFASLKETYGPIEYRVVGYATNKELYKIRYVERMYNLTELHVVSDINSCVEMMTGSAKSTAFRVPCYHSCNTQEFNAKSIRCNNYHGVEGGAVFDVRKHQLIGVATWGTYTENRELPVGFSVPNSNNFYSNYLCAKKIKMIQGMIIAKGQYQSICDFV